MTLRGAAQVDRLMGYMDPLALLAQDLARAARRRHARLTRRRRGATLRPGLGTPLWNALVRSLTPCLRPWGEKSRLARALRVPPQRVHDYFVRRSATPDAERTLELVLWLAACRAETGRRRPHPRPGPVSPVK